jgi:hypothetical protein
VLSAEGPARVSVLDFDGADVSVDDVLHGRINPGRVFDFATDLDGVVEGYKAMNERRAVKSLVRIGMT